MFMLKAATVSAKTLRQNTVTLNNLTRVSVPRLYRRGCAFPSQAVDLQFSDSVPDKLVQKPILDDYSTS